MKIFDHTVQRLKAAIRAVRPLILALVIISVSRGHLFGQVIGLDLLPKKQWTIVPFELEQGFIIVDVWLEGIIPVRMIFDTGAENTILFDKEITTLLGIQFERQIPIMGSDLDSTIIANIARKVNLRMSGCEKVKRDIIVLEDNNLLLKEKLGIPVNGILGGNFFANLVVKIDYKKNEIRLFHPTQFKIPKGYEVQRIDIRNNKPYLPVEVQISEGRRSQINLLVDTGSALPFLLHTNTDSTLTLPDQVMLGNLGYGISGVLRGFRGKVDLLKFGEFEFNQIAASFQDLDLDSITMSRTLIRNGILGNSLLSRFHVLIDYPKERIYLKAHRKYNKEFQYDKSGISLFAVGQNLDQYYVVAVILDSPAGRAGIKPGDLIHKIGRRKTKSMTLQQINNRLARKAGKKIKMTIIRDEMEIEKVFYLEEWFATVNRETIQK